MKGNIRRNFSSRKRRIEREVVEKASKNTIVPFLFDVNTANELEGYSFILGGGFGNIGIERITNENKEQIALRLAFSKNPIEFFLKSTIKPLIFDIYGSIDNTIITDRLNVTKKLEIQKKLIQLDMLIKNSKGIIENALKIYFLTESLKKDLKQLEERWRYRTTTR